MLPIKLRLPSRAPKLSAGGNKFSAGNQFSSNVLDLLQFSGEEEEEEEEERLEI